MKKLEKRLLGADYKEPVKKCKRTYVESKSWTFAKTGQKIFLGDVVEIQLVKCPDTYAKEFMTDDNRVTVKITSMSSLLMHLGIHTSSGTELKKSFLGSFP